VAGVSLLLLGGLLAILGRSPQLGPGKHEGGSELFVYCAAGMRLPMEQIAGRYQEEFGVQVRLQYGGSNSLLSQIEVGKVGDLYLAADDSYLQIAKRKSLLAESFHIARMRPVIVVPQNSPVQVQNVEDLIREDVRVSLANPDQAAVGNLVRASLLPTGQWDALAAAVRARGVFKPTVNEVANDVLLGAVDAGIVWDAVAIQHEQLKTVRSAELSKQSVLVGIGLLQTSKVPQQALHFARFLSAQDRGLKVFREHGYEPVEGALWSDDPQITLFAGAVNRQALEPIVEAFQQRHGVEVSTVYNGCGILTAQMRAIEQNSLGGFPDVYMACDTYYMETVDQLFQNKVNISDTPIVIAVQAGNPKNIASLADLSTPGIRVAIGQPDQCTIGVLTRRLLESEGTYASILENNVVTQTATSSLLIPSVATGSADAAIVYLTDAKAESEKVDVVTIDSPLAKAVQPLGIAASSKQKQLARLLFEEVSRAQEDFENAGFRWRLKLEK
jgi:molybdenum ABC transporter molybdate-binding protein